MARIIIKRTDGTEVDLTGLTPETALAMAQAEQANATWQILALMREQALASLLARPQAATEAPGALKMEDLERRVNALEGGSAMLISDLQRRIRALETARENTLPKVKGE